MDALVAKAEEGRGRLRKMLGSCQQVLIQQNPNEETPLIEILRMLTQVSRGIRGTETSKYPEEKKS